MRTDTHGSSGIRTHDHSVCAGEDISGLRQRGHCDRHSLTWKLILTKTKIMFKENYPIYCETTLLEFITEQLVGKRLISEGVGWLNTEMESRERREK
jgi:hypothetical protein